MRRRCLLVKIVNQRGKLTQYATFVLVTFIISFVVKRLKQNRCFNFFWHEERYDRAIFMTARLAVFLVLFLLSLPLWQVIKNLLEIALEIILGKDWGTQPTVYRGDRGQTGRLVMIRELYNIDILGGFSNIRI